MSNPLYKNRKSQSTSASLRSHNLFNMVKTKSLLLTLLFSLSYAKAPDSDFFDGFDAHWDQWSKNFDRKINTQVRSSLRGLDDLGTSISRQVHESLKPLDNLGDTITKQVNEDLRPLDNLGETINKQVYEGLRPVREMEFRFRVKYGEGGTTIATFKDKSLIIRNGVVYTCSGTISQADGSCSGTLSKPTFTKKEDFCYATVKSIINNQYCIGNGQVVFEQFNSKVSCKSLDGSPTLLIGAGEYKKLCENVGGTVTYKYFTTLPLGEYGPDIKCSGTENYVCTLTESNNFGGYGGTTYIHIN